MADLTHTFSLNDLPRTPDKYNPGTSKRLRNSIADKKEQCLQTSITSPTVLPPGRPKQSPASSLAASPGRLPNTLQSGGSHDLRFPRASSHSSNEPAATYSIGWIESAGGPASTSHSVTWDRRLEMFVARQETDNVSFPGPSLNADVGKITEAGPGLVLSGWLVRRLVSDVPLIFSTNRLSA